MSCAARSRIVHLGMHLPPLGAPAGILRSTVGAVGSDGDSRWCSEWVVLVVVKGVITVCPSGCRTSVRVVETMAGSVRMEGLFLICLRKAGVTRRHRTAVLGRRHGVVGVCKCASAFFSLSCPVSVPYLWMFLADTSLEMSPLFSQARSIWRTRGAEVEGEGEEEADEGMERNRERAKEEGGKREKGELFG